MRTKCMHQISIARRYQYSVDWRDVTLIELNPANLKKAELPDEVIHAFETLDSIPDEILLFSAIHFMTDNFLVIHEAI